MLTSTDPMGEQTTYKYDALGQLMQQIAPTPGTGTAATVTSYAYDADGNLLETDVATDAGAATAWQNGTNVLDVDGDGVIDPLDALPIINALNLGMPGVPLGGGTLPSLPAGTAPPYYYDVTGDGRLSAADGQAIVDYLDYPNPSLTAPGQVTQYAYDHLGRQTSQTDPDGDVTSYTYDANGNQTSLTDPDGNTTTFSYDGLNRLVGQSRTTYESGDATSSTPVSESMTYDANGNLTSQTNYDNQTIYYTYDNLNRQTQELWDSPTDPSATFTYTYDADGELTSAAAPTSTITEGYNNLGQLISDQTSGNGYAAPVTITNGYDADGNRTSSSLSFGATLDYANAYTYDALDRETSVTQQGRTGGNAVAPKRVNLTYNADGEFTAIDTYNDLAASENVVSCGYGYDAAGQLIGLTYTALGSTLAGYTWTYNALGEITTFSSSQYADENLAYDYDAAGQLTTATDTNSPSANESYSYDHNGNRTASVTPSPTGEGGGEGSVSATYATGANNEMVSDGTYTYQYDGEGNLIQQTAIVGTAYTTYAYDDRQELTTVTSYSAPGVVTQTVAYTYDAFGRRISETVAIPGGTTTETKFVYDGQAIVATLDGTNALTNRYLNGPGVDQVFADEQFTPTAAGQMPTTAGTVIYPLVDNLGTDRDLVEYDAATGLTSVVDHIAYQTYGAVTSQTNAAVDYVFGYTGLVLDPATGQNVSATRTYRPADGDWNQNDRIGFDGGQANLGEYVGNSPTNWIDPRGLEEAPPVGTAENGFNGTGEWSFKNKDEAITFFNQLLQNQTKDGKLPNNVVDMLQIGCVGLNMVRIGWEAGKPPQTNAFSAGAEFFRSKPLAESRLKTLSNANPNKQYLLIAAQLPVTKDAAEILGKLGDNAITKRNATGLFLDMSPKAIGEFNFATWFPAGYWEYMNHNWNRPASFTDKKEGPPKVVHSPDLPDYGKRFITLYGVSEIKGR